MLKNIRKNKKKKNESSIIGRLRGWFYHGRFIGFDIQSIIMTVLTALTIITTVIMGLLLYNRFKMAIKQTAVTNTENMVENTVEKLDADLLNVRQITNAVNYNIIQEYDISSRDFNRQFSLLYEINADKIQSMALYDDKGNLLTAEPVTVQKDAVEPSEQDWYQDAEADIENIISLYRISRICLSMAHIDITGLYLSAVQLISTMVSSREVVSFWSI